MCLGVPVYHHSPTWPPPTRKSLLWSSLTSRRHQTPSTTASSLTACSASQDCTSTARLGCDAVLAPRRSFVHHDLVRLRCATRIRARAASVCDLYLPPVGERIESHGVSYQQFRDHNVITARHHEQHRRNVGRRPLLGCSPSVFPTRGLQLNADKSEIVFFYALLLSFGPSPPLPMSMSPEAPYMSRRNLMSLGVIIDSQSAVRQPRVKTSFARATTKFASFATCSF